MAKASRWRGTKFELFSRRMLNPGDDVARRFLKQTKNLKPQILKAVALYAGALLAALAFGSLASAQSDPAAIEPALPASAMPLSFSRACEAGSSITIASVGDVLPHSGLAEQAYASKIGFESLWSKLVPFISAADIAYANLEGAVAKGVAGGGVVAADPGPMLNRYVYTGTAFLFNYHPRIIDDMKRSGFDILSVANNHSLDRGALGVDRTVQEMIDRGMPYSGARRITDPRAGISTVVERSGFRVAFIACTDVYNSGDSKGLITGCADESKIVSEIQRLNQDPSIDAVIITPHWGEEYRHIASPRQRAKARKFLDAGASAIIGSHPHMLQEVESYRTHDGRDTVVAYSLGNFVSGQGKRPGLKTTILLYIGLTKRAGEKAWVNGVSYLPLWMDRGPHSVNTIEKSTQAPAIARAIISKLVDPSRALRATLPIKTNIGCP